MKTIKRTLAVVLTLLMLMSVVPLGVMNVSAEEKELPVYYTVLLLDVSLSMEGEPLEVEKAAAIKYCETMLGMNKNNQIAIVKFYGSAVKVCSFTNDLDNLNARIDSLSVDKSTNINAALSLANSLLSSVTDSSVIKNIVVCSDGIPVTGSTLSSGQYTSSDHKYYKYANKVYKTASALKDKYYIYTLGFFHSLTGDDLAFGQKLMNDIQNAGFYEVTDAAQIADVFGEIADDAYTIYTLHAFSNKPNLAIGANDSLEMTFQLEGLPLNGNARLMMNASYTFASSDTHIFSIVSIDKKADKTNILINGQHPGTAMLSVSAFYHNGFKVARNFRIVVTGETVYYADNIPHFNDYNIECNGITIDNFKYDKSDLDYCTISFDAYNQMNCFGAVEVYDKTGNMIYTQAIDRYDGNLLPDSIKDALINMYSQHEYNCDYKNEEYSTKTEIYLDGVPRDGHIVISNDIAASPAAAVYNISHLAIKGVGEATKLASSLSSLDEAVEETAKTIGEEVFDKLIDTTDDTIRKISKSMFEKIMTKSNYGTESNLNQMLKTYYLYIDQLDIDLVEIFEIVLKKTAKGIIPGLIEDAIIELMGVPGKIIEKVLDAVGINNLLHEAERIGECAESGNTCVYCTSAYNEIRYSNGYMVRQSDPFDDDVSFHTYKIVNKGKRDEVSKKFEEQLIELFAMSLYENGQEVQPDGLVEVAIPVPKGVNYYDINIYRQESDGSFTKLTPILGSLSSGDGFYFDDGYIYIKTEHFSLYCMTAKLPEIQTAFFSQKSIKIKIDDVFTQYPVVTPNGREAFVDDWHWISSDESVAQVMTTGAVVGVGVGQAVISTLDGKAKYSVTVLEKEHVDDNNDGYCDNCEEKMIGGEHCLQCGKIHNGRFVDKLVGFFHRIIYRVTHLFVNKRHTHTYDEGIITTRPTCTEPGVKTYTCTTCEAGSEGHIKTEAISALGHTEPDSNGKCTRCGAKIEQPNPQRDPNACKWCGKTHEGFFQKIIGFFHSILASIFGAKY